MSSAPRPKGSIPFFIFGLLVVIGCRYDRHYRPWGVLPTHGKCQGGLATVGEKTVLQELCLPRPAVSV